MPARAGAGAGTVRGPRGRRARALGLRDTRALRARPAPGARGDSRGCVQRRGGREGAGAAVGVTWRGAARVTRRGRVRLRQPLAAAPGTEGCWLAGPRLAVVTLARKNGLPPPPPRRPGPAPNPGTRARLRPGPSRAGPGLAAMTFAEEKTYQYIRRYHSNFCSIHVLEILPYLYCLTTSDQDRLRAYFFQWGNQNTLWELFHSLQRRQGWVDALIEALRRCEKTELADEVACVYQRYLLPPAAPTPAPTTVPPPSVTSATPSSAHNGYEEEFRSPVPVQDSEPLKFSEEDSKTASQTSSPGPALQKSGDPQEPSSDMAARRPLDSSGHQEQDTEPSSAHTEGAASSLPSPRGPVSPTVSFQPLARSNPRASRLPGPSAAAPSPGIAAPATGFASVGGAGGQVEAAIYSSGLGASASSLASTVPSKLPTNSSVTSTVPSKLPTSSLASTVPSKLPTSSLASTVPSKLPTSSLTSTVPSKLPTNSSVTSTVPSKGPIISKSPGAMTTNMPTSVAASKLPINSARVGTASPKVPATSVPDHRMPTSSLPSQAAADAVPSARSGNRPAQDTAVSPGPPGAGAGGSTPRPDPRAFSGSSELELDKPGELMSRLDSPFSGCSEDLAISYSRSVSAARDNTPEENEYQTLESIRVHVQEDPSAAELLASNPGKQGTPELPREELPEERKPKDRQASWAAWLGAAAVGVLLAGLLAGAYQRRMLQRRL
ncbi:Mitochondrial antiviral-signaling protein [Galemys pyrenaicus]|uniref:Mitochondrial antiviral-signaling protein n=1 Tax=Galemys pyrenaicus TaxID=202257 RepID=A0A8J6DMN0_GALPY|nr:Mitochondrial antiviral-signaling protein [Galemys pyrenaicus]